MIAQDFEKSAVPLHARRWHVSLAMIWLGVVFTTLILYVGVDGSSELALIAAVGLLTSRTAIYSIRNILKHNCVPFPIVVTLCSTLLRLRNT